MNKSAPKVVRNNITPILLSWQTIRLRRRNFTVLKTLILPGPAVVMYYGHVSTTWRIKDVVAAVQMWEQMCQQ